MNLREGRSGVREMTAAALLAVVTNGLFAVNNADTYRSGNMQYLATVVAVLLCLLLLSVLERVMAARNAQSLDMLLTGSLGGVGGAAVGILVVGGLLLAAVLPMNRFLLILTRYVFVEEDLVEICLYLLPVIVLLAYLGLEALVRTSYLCIWPVALAFVAAILVTAPGYRVYRLFPLLGGGAPELLVHSLAALFRFLPAVAALLAVGNGAHGVRYAAKAGRWALGVGGAVTAAIQVCVGMTFTSDYLQQLPAPLYHFLMQVRYDHPTMRVDKLVLFLWIISGLLAAAFYVYAAALLYCRLFRARDVRPVAAVMAAMCTGAMLLLHFSSEGMTQTVSFLYRNAYLLLLLPLLLAAALGAVRKRKEVAWQN